MGSSSVGSVFALIFNICWCYIFNPGFSIHKADGFLMQLIESRICHIRGVLGGGKTSLAFMLTFFLRSLDDGYKYIATNVPCDLDYFPPPPVSNGIQDTLVILDEAGAYLSNRTWETNPTEFYQALRKLRTVVLCPSKAPLDVRLSELWVQRVFTLGNSAWFYYWGYQLGKDKKDGFFFVWKPSEIFGKYSTSIYSASAEDILDLFRVSLEKLSRQAAAWRSYVVRQDNDEDRDWHSKIQARRQSEEKQKSKKRWG